MANDLMESHFFHGLGANLWRGTSPCQIQCTYAESHLQDTACRPGAAADKAAANKSSEYCDLAATHLLLPVAIETAGTWNQMAVELVQEIGRRITLVTEDSRETVFLFQRLSIAIQRGNVVSFLSTFTATDLLQRPLSAFQT